LNEFDFSKISLSLDRDLAPSENPLDGFRGIHALLSRALVELQVGPKTQQTGTGIPTLPTPKPAEKASSSAGIRSLTVETVRERLAKWLPDLEILDGFDGFAVKPKRFLGDAWSEVNDVVRSLGGKWVKGQLQKDGSWRIPK
jgi:hypothetical protein